MNDPVNGSDPSGLVDPRGIDELEIVKTYSEPESPESIPDSGPGGGSTETPSGEPSSAGPTINPDRNNAGSSISGITYVGSGPGALSGHRRTRPRGLEWLGGLAACGTAPPWWRTRRAGSFICRQGYQMISRHRAR
jgi:hypothetical protein